MTTAPVTLKFADYAPDAASYNPGVTNALVNVVPRADGYGPFKAWQAFGTGLPAGCRGAITVRKSAGTTDIYAGTASKLYKYAAATSSWTDITRVSGGDYAVPEGGDWCFTLFGALLVATNGIDDNQYINIDSGANFAALTNSPKAYYCCAVGDFLWMGRLSSYPKAVAWSGVNDSSYWTYGYKGSDFQELADGGLVRGLVAVGNDCVIMQDDVNKLATRIGGNFVYKIANITQGIGCYAPMSIVPVRDTFFWYSAGGFFEGVNANPIGFERVDETVRKTASLTNLRTMRGSYDPDTNMIWWIIKGNSGSNFLLGYNWVLKKWTYVSAEIDLMFPAIPPGYTLGDWGTLGYTFATLPYTFGSAFWSGLGLRQMAGFTSSGSFGYFQGAPLAATMETTDLPFMESGKAFTNRFRLDGDVPANCISGRTRKRQYPGGTLSEWSPSVPASARNGLIWLRTRGDKTRFRIDVASCDWQRVTGLTPQVRTGGK